MYQCNKCSCQLLALPELHQYKAYVCTNKTCQTRYILCKTLGNTRMIESNLTPEYNQYISKIFNS